MRFVDTSFWIALRFRRDGRHRDARMLWEAKTSALLTTNLILGETWTFLRRRAGHRHAVEFSDAVARLPILTVRQRRRRDERPYSYVDATSFVVMRRLRMREALAFDGAFSAAGFVEVRPEPA